MACCCNPYGISHSKDQHRKSTPIKNFDRCRAVFPHFNFQKGQQLCTRCRMRIGKDFKLLQVLRVGNQLANAAAAPNTQPAPTAPPASMDLPQASVDLPPREERPCSSREALARDARRVPYTPTPVPSVGPSTSSDIQSKSSSALVSGKTTSSESDPAKKSEELNKSMKKVTFSPARPSDIKKPSVLRRKYQKLRAAASDALQKVTGVIASPEGNRKRRCGFCNTLLKELSEKFPLQDTVADKYKLLTSIPKRFTVPEILNSTGCTTYEAKTSCRLRNADGAFSFPIRHHGRPMDPSHENSIQQFYLHDDNSRASSNLRDVIQVKLKSGEKVPLEKRRILNNLQDMYQEFKMKHPEIPVSLSKFAKLRPRNCTWPGIKGHHVTCVCEIHENFGFLLDAIGSRLSVQQFVENVVCKSESGMKALCHLGVCGLCPRNEYLEELLKEALSDDEISYRQWTHTDSTEIQDITDNSDNFKKLFLEYVPKIVEHEYITAKQKSFIRNLRERTIKETASITIQADFAQNYSFVVQNAVQGFHWNNRQATVHPFVVHWWSPEDELIKYKTYCVISDEMSHDADTFHVFRSTVMPMILADLESLQIQKIYYISDGAGSQYKNFKNFANLACHKNDFGIIAEWHFTSTSHGKGTCDAISAVVKCATRRESLKPGRYITTSQQMYEFCVKSLTSPTLAFAFVSKETVSAQKPALVERYKGFKQIQGTRKNHAFIPKSDFNILIGRTSDTEAFSEIDIRKVESLEYNAENLNIGSFYAFYEGQNYQIGLLVEVDSDEGDAKFQAMKVNRRTRIASWPEIITFSDVAFREIIHELEEPSTEEGSVYTIEKDTMAIIRRKYTLYKTKLKSA